MALTLDGIAIEHDFVWIDEFDFTPIQQSETRTLTGALVFESAVKQKGRPITIAEGDKPARAIKATVDDLYALLAQNKVMTLVLPDGRTFQTRFKNDDGKPVDAKPHTYFEVMDDTDYYTLTLQLIEV